MINNESSYEVRVALVLYGGASLAVYENGVSRCFYELAQGRGIFGLLLDLLDADARIDVISGTSAGGINGLMLAAVLESGQDFAPTAGLWIRLADFERLLRDPGEADSGKSLMDSEGYYQQQLIEAFEQYCRAAQDGRAELPGEIDVFVTGTDLQGHARRYIDSLGADISDREHLVRFHFKHRPGRKALGMKGAKKETDTEVQAAILAAAARITASHPAAFSPFSIHQLDRYRGEVATALDKTSHINGIHKKSLVDGGALDNKPFGPALDAIFYRMPTSKPGVIRRLFFVEPDPDPLQQESAKPQSEPTPLQLYLASGITVRGHEGISDDLQMLRHHNQQLSCRKQMHRDLKDRLRDGSKPPANRQLYLQVRIDSLARALVLDVDKAPAALHYPQDLNRKALLDGLRAELTKWAAGDVERLNACDAFFHLRRAFDFLYDLRAGWDDLCKTTQKWTKKQLQRRQDLEAARRLTGRVIKLLKIVRDMLFLLRDHAGPQLGDKPEELWAVFRAFLKEEASFNGKALWGLKSRSPLECRGNPQKFLASSDLTAIARTIRAMVENGSWRNLQAGGPGRTILQQASVLLDQIIEKIAKSQSLFSQMDEQFYPLEFASGLHELDQIQWARISPADAQIGLSRGSARSKISGESLFHFSGFLRADWRANDIIYGRLDGICQIVRSLLDSQGLARALQRCEELKNLFTVEGLRKRLGYAPESCQEIAKRWKELIDQRSKPPSDKERMEAERNFRHSLIRAAQEAAVQEDSEALFQAHFSQEIKFGSQGGPSGVGSQSSPKAIQGAAREQARRHLQGLSSQQRLSQFQQLKLGVQQPSPRDRVLPLGVIGEYLTTIYLLVWGQLKKSLGNRGRSLMERRQVRFLFHTPVTFLNFVFVQLRKDRTLAVGLIALALGALAGLLGALWWLEQWKLLAGTLVALLLLLAVATPSNNSAKLRAVGLIILSLFLVFLWIYSLSNVELIDLELAGSGESLRKLGEKDRVAAQFMIRADYLFVAAYWLLFVVAASQLLRPAPRWRFLAVLCAVLAISCTAGFDVAENLLLSQVLERPLTELFLDQADDAFRSLKWLSHCKWSCYFLTLFFLAPGFVGRRRIMAPFCGMFLLASLFGLEALFPVPDPEVVQPVFAFSMIPGLALLSVLVACPVLLLPVARRTREGTDRVFKKRPPLVFAHRGGAKETAESSLEGFRHAARAGADVLEIDVQVTRKDVQGQEEIVVWHGPELEQVRLGAFSDAREKDHSKRGRCGRSERRIQHFTWTRLKDQAWVAKPWEKLRQVPKKDERKLLTLKEFFCLLDKGSEFSNLPVNLELKTPFPLWKGSFKKRHIPTLLNTLGPHQGRRTILITSLSFRILRRVANQSSQNFRFGSSMMQVVGVLISSYLGLPIGDWRGRALQPPRGLCPGFMVDAVHRAGGAVHVFLSRFPFSSSLDERLSKGKISEERYREGLFETLDRGVDGVMTDYPRMVRRLVDEWRQTHDQSNLT